MPPTTARLALFLFFLCGAVLALSAGPAAAEHALRRSDVVFMYDNPAMYEPYGCTVLGWAGRTDRDHIRQARDAGVRLFAVSVGFLTEFRRVMDFTDDYLEAACRNFAGEPFHVPWLVDHEYRGEQPYWWCTNSPLYRKYLDHRLDQAMAAEPTGLHIDDYRGSAGPVTWRSGGFCRHCLAGFREYLAENVPAERLAELGIDDLEGFDYRQFLLDMGVTPEDYNHRRSGLPLAAEFLDYHVRTVTAYVADYHRRAKEVRGQPVTLAVNSHVNSPENLAIAPHLSYFCCEVHHGAAQREVPWHPVYVYKLGDGLDRPVAATAGGYDWAYIKEHDLTGLVRTWTALSYAFGHRLMAPHRQWCHTPERGTHWYDGPTEEYAWLHRFVRQQERLLDDYEAVAPVAVVYDNAARRRGRGDVEPIVTALAQRNVAFTTAVAGDAWLDYLLCEEALARFEWVVVHPERNLDDDQQGVLDTVAADGRLLEFAGEETLAALDGLAVAIEGADDVLAVLREKPADPSAPLVLHLVNRRYDGERDAMVPQEDFTVRIPAAFLGERQVGTATAHAPREAPIALETGRRDDSLVISIPHLDLWTMVELAP